jgi:TDG/mug DNA glycosylase family protein
LVETLPDLLGPALRVVFVGINPSTYSVARGHYFARKTSRFWPAFSRSALSAPVRAGLGKDVLGPADDVELPRFGFGFTDVVKVPSSNAAALKPADFREWAPRLLERLRPASPRVLCFHGTMAYRPFRRWALGLADVPRPAGAWLGEQAERVGDARIFVVPNPSPANAHVRPEEQTAWYDRLAAFLGALD